MPIIIPDDLPYTSPGIEVLRFGARRGGSGIGCCAVDVIQGFSNDPDAECPPIPVFDGDSYSPIMDYNGKQRHLTGTNEDVFLSYLTHGSFTLDHAPDHAFIAVLTHEQCESHAGIKWLKILHREGFKYIDTVSNSVYSEYHPNHIFMLVRNTNEYMEEQEIESLGPPTAWREIEKGCPKTRKEIESRYYDLCCEYPQKCVTTAV